MEFQNVIFFLMILLNMGHLLRYYARWNNIDIREAHPQRIAKKERDFQHLSSNAIRTPAT